MPTVIDTAFRAEMACRRGGWIRVKYHTGGAFIHRDIGHSANIKRHKGDNINISGIISQMLAPA